MFLTMARMTARAPTADPRSSRPSTQTDPYALRMPAGQAGLAQQTRHVVEAGLEVRQASRGPRGGGRARESRLRPRAARLGQALGKRAVIGGGAASGRRGVAEEMSEVLRRLDTRRRRGNPPVGTAEPR